MDDKLFELMTQMYAEFKDFKKDMTDFKKDITEQVGGLNEQVGSLNTQVGGLQKQMLSFEDNVTRRLSALEYGYKQSIEIGQENRKDIKKIDKKLDDVLLRLNVLESKVEKQEVEIKVIKGGK